MTKTFKISFALVLILFATVIMVWRYSSAHPSGNQQITNPTASPPTPPTAASSLITEAYILKNDYSNFGYDANGVGTDTLDVIWDVNPPRTPGDTGDFIIYKSIYDHATLSFIFSEKNIISRVSSTVFRAAMMRDFGDAGDETITKSPNWKKFGFMEGAFVTAAPPRLYAFWGRSQASSDLVTDIPAYLYSSNFDGSDVRLLYTNPWDMQEHVDLQVVATDEKSLAIVNFTKIIRDPKDDTQNDSLDPQLTILALPSGKVIASLPLPGDALKYATQHGLANLPESAGWLDNIFGAWLVNPDGSVEFTRYYALIGAYRGFWSNPQSDKELWRFDPKTNQLQLLRTVPLGQFKTRFPL